MVKNVTSYSTPAVDEDYEVRNDCRDFMQNAGQDQEHNGKVVLGTTLRTIYDYEDGSHNTARFKRYSLPDELGTFSYNYGDVGGIGDKLSRPIGTSAQYGFQYLGLSSLLETRIDRGQAIRWSVILGSDAANPYGGLDRFGRVIDNLWNLPDRSTTLDLIQYGYDRVGNRIWRYNVVAHTHSAAFDEPYGYDGLNQLIDMQRGSYSTAPVLPSTAPSGFSSTPTLQQTWSLDSTGNWTGFTEAVSGSTTLDQAREANRVNEITEITNSTGSDWQPPVYDAAGNMTLMPQPASPADGFAAVYDAWNRLVRIDDVSGESPVTVQANAYDGLTRRVSKTTFGEAGEIRHYYYDIDWRVIQEYVGATPNRSNREDWDRIYAWGSRYIDELALRLRAVEGEDPEALVPLQDANWNVTAICDGTAAVVERYAYTAYGTPTFQDDTFTILSPNKSAYEWETLYCGYRFDVETGLYHVRFRGLHALLGRWLVCDPVDADANAYCYTATCPITQIDPFGLQSPPNNEFLAFRRWTKLSTDADLAMLVEELRSQIDSLIANEEEAAANFAVSRANRAANHLIERLPTVIRPGQPVDIFHLAMNESYGTPFFPSTLYPMYGTPTVDQFLSAKGFDKWYAPDYSVIYTKRTDIQKVFTASLFGIKDKADVCPQLQVTLGNKFRIGSGEFAFDIDAAVSGNRFNPALVDAGVSKFNQRLGRLQRFGVIDENNDQLPTSVNFLQAKIPRHIEIRASYININQRTKSIFLLEGKAGLQEHSGEASAQLNLFY